MNLLDIIPKDPVPPRTGNPKSLIMMASAKQGKSTVAAGLPDALHIVCDPNGGDFIQSRRVNIEELRLKWDKPRYATLMQLCDELAKTRPFKRVIIDKLDNTELWADGEATAYYKNTPTGVNFKGRSLRELPRGAGYTLFWGSFMQLWNSMVNSAEEVVFLAGTRESYVEGPVRSETFSRSDLDLTGKIKSIAVGYAEAIGSFSRNDQKEGWLTFKTSDVGSLSGSRCRRLEGAQFKLSWQDAQGNVLVDWSDIFSDCKKPTASVNKEGLVTFL